MYDFRSPCISESVYRREMPLKNVCECQIKKIHVNSVAWYLDTNDEFNYSANYSAGLRPMLPGHYFHIITLS